MPPGPDDAVRLDLTILATTDLHAQILPHDYYTGRATAPCGLAHLAARVREIRGRSANTLLFDNGDCLQGNLMADWAADRQESAGDAAAGEDRRHPVIAAMNTLGYDAATLGNHEFNYGTGLLRRYLEQADYPLVLANVSDIEGRAIAAPWVILDRVLVDRDGQPRPLRIGVIGLAPPQIARWEMLNPRGRFAATDMVETARRIVPQIRAAGADLVIALCHTGLGDGVEPGPGQMPENAGLLLSRVPGIDLLVLGHSHRLFPDPQGAAEGRIWPEGVDAVRGLVNGVPVIKAGAHGSHLGQAVLTLGRSGGDSGGRWSVISAEVGLVAAVAEPVPPPDPQVLAAVSPAHAEVSARITATAARSDLALNSHFSLLRADEGLAVVAHAQLVHAQQALAGTPGAELPLLSAVAPFRNGGRSGPGGYLDIRPGPLTLRDIAGLYIYPNTISVLEVTGAALGRWLCHSARIFRQITPGIADQPLIDPSVPGYNADVIFGLTWEIDPSRAPDDPGRLRDLCHHGRPVAATDRFALVTNSYRAAGSGGYGGVLQASRILLASGCRVQDVVLDHLRANAPVPAETVWRFSRLPGTSVLFDSAPGARVEEGPELDLEDLGLQEAGLRRFRLRL